MRNLLRYLILLLVSGIVYTAKGTVSAGTDSLLLQGKSELFLSSQTLVNPWTLSRNPAGIIFTIQEKITRFRIQFENDEENIRRAMDPRITRVLNVNTYNSQNLGKARVSGSFGYRNIHYGGLLYNGNMDFRYMNLYMLGDTVGGPQRQEGYFLSSELAYPFFSGRLTGGIHLDYESSIGAKMKDLRNKNTITRTSIIAGLVFKAGSFAAGLSGGPVIENNLTEVNAQLDERHTLFYHMGMGHYSASINFSTSESVLYESRGYTGESQVLFRSNSWRSFHTAGLFKLKTEARVGGNYRLINGITDYYRVHYYGDLNLRTNSSIHNLALNASMAKTNATEVRQESYSQSIDGVFYTLVRTLRWIEGKHIVNDLSGRLTYDLYRLGAYRPFRYNLTMQAGGGYYSATHYPAESYGYYNAAYGFGRLSYQHYFTIGKVNIDPVAEAGMKFIFSSDAEFRPFPNYIAQIPELDYRFFSENLYRAGFGADISTSPASMKGVSQIFGKVRGEYATYPGVITGKNYNLTVSLTLGTVF